MTFEWLELKVVLFAGLTALALFALVAFVVLRNGRRKTRLVRRRVDCPVHGKTAVVDFVVGAYDGEVCLDVASCSLLPPGEPVECGTVCRSASVAPFSERLEGQADTPPATRAQG